MKVLSNDKFIKAVIVPIVLYFLIEIVARIIFVWVPGTGKMVNLKIIRDLFTFALYLIILFKMNYLNGEDFQLNLKVLIPFSVIAVAFIYFLTENSGREYPLYIILEAFILSPVVEELVCRKFILSKFLPNHIWIGAIVSIAIFILLHFQTNLSTLFFYLIISCLLTGTQILSGSVINSIILHSVCNIMIFLV